jgi:hypothetical protein
MRKKLLSRSALLLTAISFPVAFIAAQGSAASGATRTAARHVITSRPLANSRPTFVGSAATGCASGCNLMTGPFKVGSVASYALGGSHHSRSVIGTRERLPSAAVIARMRRLDEGMLSDSHRIPARMRSALIHSEATAPAPPDVSCDPMGVACSSVTQQHVDVSGVRGLDAVDSASVTEPTGNTNLDIEPADQAVCAGNGYTVEANNVGEMLIYDNQLHRVSQVIPFDTVFDLTKLGWSSGGDVSCVYDYSNGGHWIFTEFASASSEASGGPFSGCFAAVAKSCYEGIAVTQGNNPFGPYNVYFVNPNYNSSEPGAPYLLNDFTKIGTTRDAFLLFYDEFPINPNFPGIGGGGFNGAQEYAIDKNALERGEPVRLANGQPNTSFNVAIENTGLLATPDGTCASDNTFHAPGISCWFAVIPAHTPDPTQWDNADGGTGWMIDTLDFYGVGDSRLGVFDWTGLSNLNKTSPTGVDFGVNVLNGTEFYYDPDPLAAQRTGPIPLGAECGAAGLSVGSPAPAACPEGQIAVNGDDITQASYAGGQIWAGASTEVSQQFVNESAPETHQGVAYFVVDTNGFAKTGNVTLSAQGYLSAAHEDLAFPAFAASGTASQDGGDSGALATFTLTGVDYYPSTAYMRFASNGMPTTPVQVADPGLSPQDGFTEYLGYPDGTRPRWGDYSAAVFVPFTGTYFAGQYIEYPTCYGTAFTLTVGTCGGTRDGNANWGTSVNYASLNG